MREKVKQWWDYVQSLFDVDGDLWMGLFTSFILVRLLGVFYGHPPITSSEAAVYASAVGAFAYSNKGGPKP